MSKDADQMEEFFRRVQSPTGTKIEGLEAPTAEEVKNGKYVVLNNTLVTAIGSFAKDDIVLMSKDVAERMLSRGIVREENERETLIREAAVEDLKAIAASRSKRKAPKAKAESESEG